MVDLIKVTANSIFNVGGVVYDDVSFPTVSTQSVMMVIATAAAERRVIAVSDIGSAS